MGTPSGTYATRDREQALRWHSIAVLWKFYAKLLWGQRHRANQLIDDALNNMPDNAERLTTWIG